MSGIVILNPNTRVCWCIVTVKFVTMTRKEELQAAGVWDKLQSAIVFSKITGEELLWGSINPEDPTIFYGGLSFMEIDLTQDQWKDCAIQID